MYYRLDENELKRMERVRELTNTDYELKGDFVPVDSLVCMVEDLLGEIDYLQEKYDDFKTEVEECYVLKSFDPYDEYGVSREDFF